MSFDWYLRWLALLLLSLVDAIWLNWRGIGFSFGAVTGRVFIAFLLLIGSFIATVLAARLRQRVAILAVSVDFFCSIVQFLLLVPPAVTLVYLGAALDAPLADGALQQADQWLGFDWWWVDGWVFSQPWLATTLIYAYDTILWQPFLVMLVVSTCHAGESNSEFVWIFLVSMVLCAAVSALCPALGYDGVIGPAHIEALKEVRSGALHVLDLNKIDGIVTFPSFHAALAVIFPYLVRRSRGFFWLAATVNALMLASTPTVGGHYLVDVLAGTLLALVSILLAQFIRRAGTTAQFRLRASASVGDRTADAILSFQNAVPRQLRRVFGML